MNRETVRQRSLCFEVTEDEEMLDAPTLQQLVGQLDGEKLCNTPIFDQNLFI